MKLFSEKYAKATAAAAITSSLLLSGCASAEAPQDKSALGIANEYGQREVTSFNIGKVTVRILTSGQQGDEMPIIDKQAFKDAVTQLVEEPLNLDELFTETPDLTEQDINKLKKAMPDVQSELESVFSAAINGPEDKVWTIILPSERDTCVGDGTFVSLPTREDACSPVSSAGITVIAAESNGGKLTINSNEVATIIAPNTVDDKTILHPLGKNIEMSAAQTVESTIGHEAVHVFLAFNGINDYLGSKEVEETLIQVLELNAAKNISKGAYPVTWS